MVLSQFLVSSFMTLPTDPHSASRFPTQEIHRSSHAIPAHSRSYRTIAGVGNSQRRPPVNMRMAARQEGAVIAPRYPHRHPLSACVVTVNPAGFFLMPQTRPRVATGTSRDMLVRQSPVDQLRRIFGPSFDVHLEKSRTNAMCEAVRRGDTGAVQLLLNVGADRESRDQCGRTPLILAVLSDSRPVIDVLLKSGANPNAHDQSGNTPMMYAAKQNNPYLIYKLRRAGGATDASNKCGNTALIAAIEHHHWQAVRSLLDRNTEGSMAARPDVRNALGTTPLSVALAIRVRLGLSSYSGGGGMGDSGCRETIANNQEIIRALLTAEVNATGGKEIIQAHAA